MKGMEVSRLGPATPVRLACGISTPDDCRDQSCRRDAVLGVDEALNAIRSLAHACRRERPEAPHHFLCEPRLARKRNRGRGQANREICRKWPESAFRPDAAAADPAG